MSDLISRQAVIDAINENAIFENEYNLTASRIKKAVEDLPSTVDWIPVTERLPDEMGMYLVTLDYGVGARCVASLYFHNDKIGWERSFDKEVKAWMPLPKPYKEGE